MDFITEIIFSLISQENWGKIHNERVFKTGITSIKLNIKGKEFDVSLDEYLL